MPRWQVRERAAGQVREDLLDDGVVAVLRLGLDQLERGIGEYRVLCRAAGYAGPRPGGCSWVAGDGAGGGITLA